MAFQVKGMGRWSVVVQLWRTRQGCGKQESDYQSTDQKCRISSDFGEMNGLSDICWHVRQPGGKLWPMGCRAFILQLCSTWNSRWRMPPIPNLHKGVTQRCSTWNIPCL